MRLKTRLVLAATAVTFGIVLVLSGIFLLELLRQRISQTTADNEVLAHEVVLMARQALELGLRNNPPTDASDAAFDAAVVNALRNYDPLDDTMAAIIRYSPTVEDVSVLDSRGRTLSSTNPEALDQPSVSRTALNRVRDGSFPYQMREMFGRPHVLDIPAPLRRNGQPFLEVHVGVRSTFLRATYEPWLHQGLWFALVAAVISMLAAALLATAALEPINRISDQLEMLSGVSLDQTLVPVPGARGDERDAVLRAGRSIDRLGQQMRSTEAEYTALQANLNQMLDTLRDGVLLFTADWRAAMVSDAVAHFLEPAAEPLVGKRIDEIFTTETALGAAVLHACSRAEPITAESVVLENGRRIQLSIDRVQDGGGLSSMGTLLTLRDIESAIKIEQELEVSRRLVAIGRLTAGVSHEVKNPINAMVLHLELLRGKLAKEKKLDGAQRHVDILVGEMQRLDRVVQTLADFSRPMELQLAEHDLRDVVEGVLSLTGEEMRQHQVRANFNFTALPVAVYVDADLIRQAMLNLLLNAMQAMPGGGAVQVSVQREAGTAIVEVTDDGEGIPPELLPRIFDLFFTTKEAGSGIGLATTYRILQMHGGALEVRSSTAAHPEGSPRGTTFTLRLPLATQHHWRRLAESEAASMEVESRV